MPTGNAATFPGARPFWPRTATADRMVERAGLVTCGQAMKTKFACYLLFVQILRSPNALEFCLGIYACVWGAALAYGAEPASGSVLATMVKEYGSKAFVGGSVAIAGIVSLLSLLQDWRKGRAYTSVASAVLWLIVAYNFWSDAGLVVSDYATYVCVALAEIVVFVRVWHGFDKITIGAIQVRTGK